MNRAYDLLYNYIVFDINMVFLPGGFIFFCNLVIGIKNRVKSTCPANLYYLSIMVGAIILL